MPHCQKLHDHAKSEGGPGHLELARARNAEWIFVTDGTGANPYQGLPEEAYWENQLRLVST